MPDCVLGLHPNKAEELVGFDLVLWLGFVSFFFPLSVLHTKEGERSSGCSTGSVQPEFLGDSPCE